jgi:hypothetical protein
MRPVPRTRVAILLATALVAPTATNDSGEIGITAQNTHELKILSGNGHIETVPLPDRSQPHTITFSPDGSYAYVSNLGDGNLLVVRNAGPADRHDDQPWSRLDASHAAVTRRVNLAFGESHDGDADEDCCR